jgi:hypothetical protein
LWCAVLVVGLAGVGLRSPNGLWEMVWKFEVQMSPKRKLEALRRFGSGERVHVTRLAISHYDSRRYIDLSIQGGHVLTYSVIFESS